MDVRPYSFAINKLRAAGIRPTRQRVALAKLLFEGSDRHVTAEGLYADARHAGVGVTLATVYNSLNQLTEAGLLREIVVDPHRRYFDTNISDHHHFFHEESGILEDISGKDVVISKLPDAPEGRKVCSVDVVIRISG